MAELSNISSSRDMVTRQKWKVGDTFKVFSDPTVEGMITGTKWINEAFMVILVVPAYTKKDSTKEKAAVLLRTPAACSCVKLDSYDFPFPTDSKFKEQVIDANGSHALLQEVILLLNNTPIFLPITPVLETSSPPVIPLSPMLEQPTEISDHISVQLALSQSKEDLPQLPQHLQDEGVLDHLARELSRRLTFTSPASPHPLPQPSPTPAPLPSRHQHRHSRSSSRRTGSFSNSSTSRSSSASRSRKVRKHNRHRSSGLYTCPFLSSDTRNLPRPSKQLHAKSEERKYLRYALHDIYNEHTTLKYFVDSIRTTLVSSPTKPYTSDLIWLEHHADYLDAILLHSSTGPWTTWNELVIDKLTRVFLELVIRVSPRRKYPDVLEEPIRKWMKRKRVGVASQYGPVPSFLAQAKVTDTGIEPKNGWEAWKPKENAVQYGASGGTKGRSSLPSATEKK